MKPKLLEHIVILRHNSNEVVFYQSDNGLVTTFCVDSFGEQAILEANGEPDLKSIHGSLQPCPYSRKDLEAFFKNLIDEGFFRDASGDDNLVFPHTYEKRLKRQIPYFASLAPSGRTARHLLAKLLNSKVLIIGVGGAGSHLAVQLAGIGVGHLTVVDWDHVEHENLGRQICYSSYVGQLKVEALKEVISQLAPETNVEIFPYRLEEDSKWPDKIIEGTDLVVNCADFPSMDITTRWLYSFCYRHRKPLIPAGGYNGHLTSIPPTLLPYKSTCWYCFDQARRKQSGEETPEFKISELRCGVFLPAVVAMASIQMMEILRILTNFEPPQFTNCRSEFDLRTCTLQKEYVAPDPSCQYCNL